MGGTQCVVHCLPCSAVQADPSPSAADQGATLSGRVVGPDGKPSKGADVWLCYYGSADPLRDRLIGHKRADSKGQFTFEKAIVWPVSRERDDFPGTRPKFEIIARQSNRAMGFRILLEGEDTKGIQVKLTATKKVSLGVRDRQGKPVRGARAFVGLLHALEPFKPSRPPEYETAFVLEEIVLSAGVTDSHRHPPSS